MSDLDELAQAVQQPRKRVPVRYRGIGISPWLIWWAMFLADVGGIAYFGRLGTQSSEAMAGILIVVLWVLLAFAFVGFVIWVISRAVKIGVSEAMRDRR